MDYENYLRAEELSSDTVRSYLATARMIDEICPDITLESLHCFKEKLIERYAPTSVNQRIHAANHYLSFLGKDNLKMKSIKIPARRYLQSSLSLNDYERLKRWLKKEGLLTYYFSIRIMANTGVRVSELVCLDSDDVFKGFSDVCGKGNKTRRIYFPQKLKHELEQWLYKRNQGICLSYDEQARCFSRIHTLSKTRLILNRFGEPLSARGLSGQLKVYAKKCGVNPTLVHPHAFRHLFARQFLQQGGDIALLADLLGHSSIETTRLYLRQTTEEQRRSVETIVQW